MGLNDYDRDIDSLYIVRVQDEDHVLRAARLESLEELIKGNDNASLEHVISPISAVIAFIYDDSFVSELEEQGYELLKQERRRMIEPDSLENPGY